MSAVFSLSACIYARHGTERSSKQFDLVERKMSCVSETRTAADQKSTDTRCERSLCNSRSWTHSNCSQSNIVISHCPKGHYSFFLWMKKLSCLSVWRTENLQNKHRHITLIQM